MRDQLRQRDRRVHSQRGQFIALVVEDHAKDQSMVEVSR
jgi:hypothetical protein